MIHDCFLLFNELDLLELRLNILNEVVDHFVIAEATRSHQNKPKPLYFEENRERFKEFEDKITYLVIPEEKFNDESWGNERLSFEYLYNGIRDAEEEDTILLGALDEIPDPKVVREYTKGPRELVSNLQRFYIYYLNTRFNHEHSATVNHSFFRGTTFLKRELLNSETFYPTMMRGRQGEGVPEMSGGWHYTFLGDANAADTKIHNYGHTEFNHINADRLQECIATLTDPLCRGGSAVTFSHFEKVEEMPKYLVENIEKYKNNFRTV